MSVAAAAHEANELLKQEGTRGEQEVRRKATMGPAPKEDVQQLLLPSSLELMYRSDDAIAEKGDKVAGGAGKAGGGAPGPPPARKDVKLLGKLVALRYFRTNATNNNGGYRRLQLRLTDGQTNMQVLLSRRINSFDGSKLMGKWIVMTGLEIRARNPAFDSSACAYSAYDTPSTNWCLAGKEHDEEVASREERFRDALAYAPALTRIADLKPDTCVNVAAVTLEEPVRVQPDTGDMYVAVKDDSSECVALLVVPESRDADDVYRLDGASLRQAPKGSTLILLDFRCVVDFGTTHHSGLCSDLRGDLRSGKMVCLQLRAWGPSRLKVGTRSAEVSDRLAPVIERIIERDSDSFDLAMNASTLKRMFPCVSGLLSGDDGETAAVGTFVVYGTVCDVRSAQNGGQGPLTRTRCDKDYTHLVDVDDNGATRCAMCDGKVSTTFTMVTEFREARARELRWATNATRSIVALVGSAVFVKEENEEKERANPVDAVEYLVNDSVEAFCRADDAAQREALAGALIGSVVAMRVWCKDDGSKLVMDAGIVPKDEAAVIAEKEEDEDRAVKRRRMDVIGGTDNAMLLADL